MRRELGEEVSQVMHIGQEPELGVCGGGGESTKYIKVTTNTWFRHIIRKEYLQQPFGRKLYAH